MLGQRPANRLCPNNGSDPLPVVFPEKSNTTHEGSDPFFGQSPANHPRREGGVSLCLMAAQLDQIDQFGCRQLGGGVGSFQDSGNQTSLVGV